MSLLHETLTRQLQRKVQAHGLVIWEDPASEYASVAASVTPDGVTFEAFQGSWYELRRRVESLVAGETPPALILYVSRAPKDDPMQELRSAGVEFKRRLSKLVEQALEGKLPPHRIAAIAHEAQDLTEAEAAAAHTGEVDVRLVRALGPQDVVGIVIRVLEGSSRDLLTESQAWESFRELCLDAVGVKLTSDPDRLRSELFRYLVLSELDLVAPGSLPNDIREPLGSPGVEQRKQAVEILHRLQSTPAGRAAYLQLAAEVDEALGLREELTWRPGLEDVPGPASVDDACFREAIGRLSDNDYGQAAVLADSRLASALWTAVPGDTWSTRWRAIRAICELHESLGRQPVPDGSTGEMLQWYVDGGWQVDRAHRRLELSRTELSTFGPLEDALTSARLAYDDWLDGLLNRFTSRVSSGGLDVGSLLRQGEIHDRLVVGEDGLTAYVWVDALRYELGRDLADALSNISENVSPLAALAAAPTITPVGMANLLPGAISGLNLTLDGDRLQVWLNGTEIDGVPARRTLLQARHGQVADLDLNEAAQQGEKSLQSVIGSARLVLLRAQEVDAAGESGLLAVAWPHFETVVNLLASVIARLAQAGVKRAVITADHGFIALSQDLGSHRLVDAPKGAVGTTKRRVFIGRGGSPNPATVRVPLSDCGISGELDLIVPRGLAVFKAGGGRQFFHGGLSPQELVVPVVIVDLMPSAEPPKLQVDVVVAGGRITTGVFAATLGFQGDLFTDEVTVRLLAAAAGREPVARVVSGDGYHPDTGTVTVERGMSSVLTFQITRNLKRGSKVELQVLDARTGRKLTSQEVEVSAPVVVEDQF